MSYTIEFESPLQRITGERRSKLLKVGSPLYDVIMSLRRFLATQTFVLKPSRPPHIELLNASEDSEELLCKRIEELQKTVIISKQLAWLHAALVLRLPPINGYFAPHITIECFERPTADEKRRVLDSVLEWWGVNEVL